jgi:hypothetical protein
MQRDTRHSTWPMNITRLSSLQIGPGHRNTGTIWEAALISSNLLLSCVTYEGEGGYPFAGRGKRPSLGAIRATLIAPHLIVFRHLRMNTIAQSPAISSWVGND